MKKAGTYVCFWQGIPFGTKTDFPQNSSISHLFHEDHHFLLIAGPAPGPLLTSFTVSLQINGHRYLVGGPLFFWKKYLNGHIYLYLGILGFLKKVSEWPFISTADSGRSAILSLPWVAISLCRAWTRLRIWKNNQIAILSPRRGHPYLSRRILQLWKRIKSAILSLPRDRQFI